MNKPLQLIGIVTVGSTRAEAAERYSAVASGKGVAAMRDEGETIALLTHGASLSSVFNPMSGDMDLVEDQKLLEGVNFQAESSVDGKDVFYVHCSDGCGAHVMADTPVSYCPACTASLSAEEADGETETDEEPETDTDTDVEPEETEGEAETDVEPEEEPEETQPDPIEVLNTGCESGSESDDEDLGEDDLDLEDDMGEGDEEPTAAVASSFSEALKLFATSSSSIQGMASTSSGGQVQAHAAVCSAVACGVKIVSDVPVHSCPMCSASTADPEGDDLSELNGTVDTDEGEGDESGLSFGLSDEEGEMSVGDGELEGEPELDSESADGVDDLDEDEGEGDEGVLEFDATDTLPMEAESSSLDVMYGHCSGNAAWFAVYDGVPVARVLRSECSADHKEMFDTDTFGRATLAAAKHGSVKESLAQMGFKPIRHQVSISNVVAQCIESGIADKIEAVDAERESFRKDFAQCLATASAGISRGFFPNMQNPLKAVLCEALSAAGMDNAGLFVDNAFSKAADAYHAGLIDKAVEIFSKPAEVRASLSQTIMGCNHVSTSSTGNQATFGDRLASMGSAVQVPKEDLGRSTSQSSVAQSDFMSDLSAVVGQLGRRRS